MVGIGTWNGDGYFGSGQEVAATCALFDFASEKFATLLLLEDVHLLSDFAFASCLRLLVYSRMCIFSSILDPRSSFSREFVCAFVCLFVLFVCVCVCICVCVCVCVCRTVAYFGH